MHVSWGVVMSCWAINFLVNTIHRRGDRVNLLQIVCVAATSTGAVTPSLPSPIGPSTVLVLVLGTELLWGD